MLKIEKRVIIILSILLAFSTIFFIFIDWDVDGFELLKPQKYELYFQSWIAIAGVFFTLIMAIITFIINTKINIHSLKFISLSFLMTSIAYLIIGYHSAYCKSCSDLTMCSSSHNYPNYLTVIALIIFVLSVLLMNLKNNISLLKLFSYGLILASFVMLVILFVSIEFMEIPQLTFYTITTVNLQGFVFVFPLLLIVLAYIYLKKIYMVTNSIRFIFVLLCISFIPQAYHTYVCTDCHTTECSEFFVFSGLLMFIAIGLLVCSINLQLKEKSNGIR